MTSIQPQLWVDQGAAAVASSKVAFGATGRTLLVVDDPDAVMGQALGAGATEEWPAIISTAGVSEGLSTLRSRVGGRPGTYQPVRGS